MKLLDMYKLNREKLQKHRIKKTTTLGCSRRMDVTSGSKYKVVTLGLILILMIVKVFKEIFLAALHHFK